jgi:adenosylcobinamide-GDP ribazoletransferase
VLILSSHVISRVLPMALVALLPHVGDAAGSKSKPLADRISGWALWSNVFWCFGLIPFVVIAQAATEFIAGIGLAFLLWSLMWWRLSRRLQGFTGDALGATQQVCEIGFLLGCLLALGAS